ncbi:MAG TPA: substrate-binding domain-containing protein [Puia sp.]
MTKKNATPLAGVKEIARLAGVSIATVDRVIHKREGVSAKTKKKIEAIIGKLNYQPNILAQRLALASRGTIRLAVLLPNISQETEFWMAPLEGIRQAQGEIKRYNVHVENYFFDQNDQQSFVKQMKALAKYKTDGILFTPTFPEESLQFIESLEKAECPYVLINCDIPGHDSLGYIGPDILHSGYLAGQLLHYCIKGGEKILIVNISGEIDNNSAILRKEEGFRRYFKENGLENELLSFNTTQTDYSSVSRKLDALLKKQKGVEAIFVTNSRVSVLARYLEKAGLNDMLLLGYDFVKDNVTYLKKGVIDFLICEKPQEQGYRGIMTLFQHLVFSSPIEKKYLMPIDIITKENCQFYRN